MRRGRGALVGFIAVMSVVAAACYPPSQTPTPQPIPPGGRVVATSAAMTDMWIEAASDDLATIVYTVQPLDIEIFSNPRFTFFVWDELLDRNTLLPTGSTPYIGGIDIAPDTRSVVFASHDHTIQAVPPTVSCWRSTHPQGPPYVAETCSQLYVYDLDTRQRTQLTGLDGASGLHSYNPRFSEDGTGVDFSVSDGRDRETFAYRHLDLATGAVTEGSPPVGSPASWDRGDHQVDWDGNTGTLTSTDVATGAVTTLWADPEVYALASQRGDGRYIVVSRWVTDQKEVLRLIDTDTGAIRPISTPWISDDGSTFALVQRNVAPDAIDRLVVAPVQW